MDVLLAIALGLACGSLILRVFLRPDARLFHVFLLSVFSLGYLVLPIALKRTSGLLGFDDDEVAAALGIHALYYGSLLAGYFFFLNRSPKRRAITLPRLDALIESHPVPLFFVAFAAYVLYFATNDVTSYSAQDFQSYFEDRSLFASLLAAVATYCQALMAISLVAALGRSSRSVSLAMCSAYALILVLLLSAGQRLAMISPCISLVLAFALAGQGRRALRLVGATVLILAAVSPFAVYLREAASGATGKEKIVDVGRGFSYGGDAVSTAVFSLSERADLVLNTILLKQYIDRAGYVGPQFYYSVLVSPIPRLVLTDKPALLSADGTPAGEISVLAWRLDKGYSIGSLTAFGGITAYRQGGWWIVALDGLLVGAVGAFLFRWLGRGGAGGWIFYVVLVPLLVVKRVPASLFEALAEILPVLMFIALAVLVDRLLGKRFTLGRPNA